MKFIMVDVLTAKSNGKFLNYHQPSAIYYDIDEETELQTAISENILEGFKLREIW